MKENLSAREKAKKIMAQYGLFILLAVAFTVYELVGTNIEKAAKIDADSIRTAYISIIENGSYFHSTQMENVEISDIDGLIELLSRSEIKADWAERIVLFQIPRPYQIPRQCFNIWLDDSSGIRTLIYVSGMDLSITRTYADTDKLISEKHYITYDPQILEWSLLEIIREKGDKH